MRHQMQKQRGTTLVLTVLSLTALLGAAALAIDQGMMDLARQQAQDCADAAALAGAQLLPNTAAAMAAAEQVIAANNQSIGPFGEVTMTSPSTIICGDGTVLTVGAGDSFVVSGSVDAPLAFGPAVGFTPVSQDGKPNTLSVSAEAAVAVQTTCGIPAGVGLAPFGLIGDEPNSADPTARYVASMLGDAESTPTPEPGVYQPIASYGGEKLTLKLNNWNSAGTRVEDGNMDPVQIGTSVNQLSEEPLQTGQSLSVNSSASSSLAQTDLEARLAPSNTAFTHNFRSSPAYSDWFFGNPNDPVDPSLPPVTDPDTGVTYSYHADPNRQEITDAHILILPIVSQSVPNGEGPVTVLAFAAFFVEEPLSDFNDIAQGRFIGIMLPSANGGACTAAGLNTPPQLVR
jgi:Flp pilus assembly protein TadG